MSNGDFCVLRMLQHSCDNADRCCLLGELIYIVVKTVDMSSISVLFVLRTS